ncbi:MAG: Cellulose-binding domain protein, partial [Polyangiaceae bacterium]|nr:Cellulose-binding domain protein [Polyangiaceae bacterium]
MRVLKITPSQVSTAFVLSLSLSLGACAGNLSGEDPGCRDNCTSVGGSGVGGSSNPGVGAAGMATGGSGVMAPPGIEGIGWSTRYPRLSHAQWENTVRDLLLLDAPPKLASTFALDPDARFDTFNARTVSANLWLDYQRAAEVVAADVAGNPAKLSKVASPAAQGDAKAFVTELGTRAYRRPLTEAEITRHTLLFEQAAGMFEGGDAFARGAELLIRALLQSPHFLYRVESSTQAQEKRIFLGSYEVASRLSYGLWNTMPSAELFDAAAAGELATAEGVTKWTQAMLEDTRAKAPLVAFHDQLFNVTNYGTIAKNQKLFPTFTAELGPVLREEARLFFEEIVVTRGASVAGLLTTPVAFVNQVTAPFYGLSAAGLGSQLTRMELDPAKRAGVLTQVGFLSKYASQAQSDPILRGVHVSLDMICSALPAPPNDIPPLPAQLEGQTNRQRVEALTGNAPCSACHDTFINPLGFAFESYDAVG